MTLPRSLGGVAGQRLVVVVIAATTISGCGLVAYSEPDSGPIARVRFVNYSNGVVSGLRQYDDNNCLTGERELARFSGRLIHNHQSLGIPNNPLDVPDGQKIEVRIRGGQPFNGVYWSSAESSDCRLAFEFLPEAGLDYQVTFNWNLYQPSSCSATLATVEEGAISSSKIVHMAPGRCQEALTKTYLY